jgi:hypothetical protein
LKFDSEVIEQKLVQNEFMQTFELVRGLDFCEPTTFPLVYGFKKIDAEDYIKMS